MPSQGPNVLADKDIAGEALDRKRKGQKGKCLKVCSFLPCSLVERCAIPKAITIYVYKWIMNFEE